MTEFTTGVRDALDRYWEDDTVELFIDENKNGGQHGYNTSAWAYHSAPTVML